jgi:hypothetical protein
MRMPLKPQPQPPREYVAFVARHLHRLRHDAGLLASDELEAHELYSQALTDLAIRWQWFVLLRRLNRPDAAAAYLQETLVRRSARRQAVQADFVEVEVEVWFSGDPREADGYRPDPPAPPRRSRTAARTLPLAVFGVEIGPVTEASVAWWHAYTAHRNVRLGAIAAAVLLVLAMALPYLQSH